MFNPCWFLWDDARLEGNLQQISTEARTAPETRNDPSNLIEWYIKNVDVNISSSVYAEVLVEFNLQT